MRPAFGTDGVRGSALDVISVDFVYCLGQAIAIVLGTSNEFVIGRDTRSSGEVLLNALASGLSTVGAKVFDVGIMTTPGISTVAMLNNSCACAITASHNPGSDNGVKVFGLGGTKILSDHEAAIETELTTLLDVGTTYVAGKIPNDISETARKQYLSFLAGKSSDFSDLSIVLDCANGAAFSLAPEIFSTLGANVHAIHTESDGAHINEKCGATHLESLSQEVVSKNADIGFAYDGDADRLIAVDNTGKVRDGDYLIALIANHLKAKGQLANDTVVATSMSNGSLRKYLESSAIEFCETPVGDKYVATAMKDTGAVLGGEQSGHIIQSNVIAWGDGILNSLSVCEIVSHAQKNEPGITTSVILGLFEPMAQLHHKVIVRDKTLADSSDVLKSAILREKRALGDGSRIIIRSSGTEDVVRITVEATKSHEAEQALTRLTSIVEEVCR